MKDRVKPSSRAFESRQTGKSKSFQESALGVALMVKGMDGISGWSVFGLEEGVTC